MFYPRRTPYICMNDECIYKLGGYSKSGNGESFHKCVCVQHPLLLIRKKGN